LRTPDAIQIATGLRAGATLAITNDRAWRSVPRLETALLTEHDEGSRVHAVADLPAITATLERIHGAWHHLSTWRMLYRRVRM
jgi:hypothetical protein